MPMGELLFFPLQFLRAQLSHVFQIANIMVLNFRYISEFLGSNFIFRMHYVIGCVEHVQEEKNIVNLMDILCINIEYEMRAQNFR